MFVRQNIILYCILILIILHSTAFAQDPATIEEDIEQMNSRLELYFKNGEMDKIAALYSDEAYLLTPQRIVTGREDITTYWTMIENPVEWDLEVIKVTQNERELYRNEYYEALERKPPGWRERGIELKDDIPLVYQLGRSTLKTRNEKGNIQSSIVNFILIWEVQQDGSYRILLDTYTW